MILLIALIEVAIVEGEKWMGPDLFICTCMMFCRSMISLPVPRQVTDGELFDCKR